MPVVVVTTATAVSAIATFTGHHQVTTLIAVLLLGYGIANLGLDND